MRAWQHPREQTQDKGETEARQCQAEFNINVSKQQAISLEQVMRRSIGEQGWVRQHPSSSDSAKYGAARPSSRPPVIPAAIYAADTWKGTTRISHMLDVFHRRCLRTILGITWRDHTTNEELM